MHLRETSGQHKFVEAARYVVVSQHNNDQTGRVLVLLRAATSVTHPFDQLPIISHLAVELDICSCLHI